MTKIEEQEQYYDELLETMSNFNETQLVEALSRMTEAQITGVLKSQIRQVNRLTKKVKTDLPKVESAAGKNINKITPKLKKSIKSTRKYLKDLEDTKVISKMTEIMIKSKDGKLDNLDGIDKSGLKSEFKDEVKKAKSEDNNVANEA